MIKNRILKNLARIKGLLKSSRIFAYRIYDKDIPDYPYIIDVYNDYFVIYEKGIFDVDETLRVSHLADIKNALIDIFKTDESHLIVKRRIKTQDFSQYNKLSNSEEMQIVEEGPAKFYVNLKDYLDTGLFLDHRPMRNIIYKISNRKKVLNLFSYTASVSVYAALGGGSVTSVDSSTTYQNWAKKNFILNNLDISEHQFIVENALTFIKECSSKFDIIFLDPPTFSNSKRMEHDFEVERDQQNLINDVMKLLKQDGVLYFSTNKRKFKLDDLILSKYKILDITKKTIPFDFRDEKIHKCFEISYK